MQLQMNGIGIFGGIRYKCEIDIHVTISHFLVDARPHTHIHTNIANCTHTQHFLLNGNEHLNYDKSSICQNPAGNHAILIAIQTNKKKIILYHLYRMKYESNKLNGLKKMAIRFRGYRFNMTLALCRFFSICFGVFVS